MFLVIGSYALNNVTYIRNPTDLDIIVDWQTLASIAEDKRFKLIPTNPSHFVGTFVPLNKRLEITVANKDDTNSQLLDLHRCAPTSSLADLEVVYPNLDWLYTLKMSHRFKKNSPHFHKTMSDILFMRTLGAKIADLDWFELRQRQTLTKHPKLNQSKGAFFDTPGINYVYDHDSIHLAMALGSRPAYEEYKDGEVWCSKRLWDEQPHIVQLRGVLEEALVLALERSQIPFDFKPNLIWSFKFALEKVCTSITSGWFREFAWEHYHQVLDQFSQLPWNYVDRFQECLQQNIIRRR